MNPNQPDTCEAERFLEESGILAAINREAVGIKLGEKLYTEGAVCSLRREGCLQLRALLARRWEWSGTERIEAKLVSDILSVNPYAKIQAIQVRKHGRYIEARIDVT